MSQLDFVVHFFFLDPSWADPPDPYGPAWKPQMDKWYCGHCIDIARTGDGWDNNTAAKNHAKKHMRDSDTEPEEGYDYMTGQDLLRTIRRYRRRALDVYSKFRNQMETIQGADDFLTDCGDPPLPDMAWDD